MKQPSVMKHSFAIQPNVNVQRSSFDRSHGHKTTFNAGELIPIFCDEAYPGDTFNMNMTGFARLATPLHPFMDNVFLDTQWFAVPVRLIWDNFKKFMGEQENPGDSIDYLVPQMVTDSVTGAEAGSISDYLGIPTEVPDLSHSALFHRAINLIWNEWYRDQNLQDSVTVNKDDGPDPYTDYTILKRGKRHDYFTSTLPWPQKGEEVSIPLGDYAPVVGIGKSNQTFDASSVSVYETGETSTSTYANAAAIGQNDGMANRLYYIEEDPDNPGYPGVFADLQDSVAATVNTIRLGVTVQQMLERDARYGTRYIEQVKSHFGVTSPDARLQRPEFLGSGTSAINVTPIAQTSESATTPQGNLAAMGTGVMNNHSFTKSFTEHSVVIGFVSARADLTYQQGLNRKFSRRTRYDYYWPTFANIGEQAVLNKEIYAQGSAVVDGDGEVIDDQPFGYQEAWADLRYFPSIISGHMRSNFAQSLDTWHLSQDFSALPTLNSDFIEDNPPIDRVIATPDEPHFLIDTWFKYHCSRPMPVNSIPGLTRF